MPTEPPALTAWLCDEPSTLRMALQLHLERAGFSVAGGFERGAQLLATTGRAPDVIVMDLVLAGPTGTSFLRTLRTAFPASALLVFVPIPTLEEAVLAAGADEVFTDLDLRRFAEVVRALGASVGTPSAAGGDDHPRQDGVLSGRLMRNPSW